MIWAAEIRCAAVLVWMLAVALLLLMVGCAFHSGARHAFAQKKKALVRGHHGKILLTWLVSLLSILPLVVAVIAVIFRYLPSISDLNGLLMGTSHLPATKGTILILGIGALLTLPLLPLRSLIPAAFVDGLAKRS